MNLSITGIEAKIGRIGGRSKISWAICTFNFFHLWCELRSFFGFVHRFQYAVLLSFT